MARISKRILNTEAKLPQDKLTNNDILYNVAIYLRLSIEEKRDKKESESLTNQKYIILDFLKDKKDMTVFDTYIDNGETGTNFERESFQRMLYDIYNGKVNCIIVKDLSRFGREYIESGDYLERIFPLLGVRFISINDNYDNKITPYDISIPIKNIINSMYAKDISRKSAAALRIKQLNGEFIGGQAPYGYLIDPKDNHKLIVDDVAAPIVRQIFEWKAADETLQSIARKLHQLNIMPPARYKYDIGILNDKRYAECELWNTTSLNKILSSEMYIGNMVQGQKKSNYSEGGVGQRKVKREDWIIVKGTHEPIISEELFFVVQQKLNETKRNYYDKYGKNTKYKNGKNLYINKIICGNCGSKLHRYSSTFTRLKKSYHSFICNRRRNFNDLCELKAISESVLNEIVMKSIRMQIIQLCDLEQTINNALKTDVIRTKRINLTKKLSNIYTNIGGIKSHRIELVKKYANGEIDETAYKKEIFTFDGDLRIQEKRLEDIKIANDRFEQLTSASKWIAEFKKYRGSKILTKEMVDAFVEQLIVYTDNRIEIKWTYQGKYEEALSEINGGVLSD